MAVRWRYMNFKIEFVQQKGYLTFTVVTPITFVVV